MYDTVRINESCFVVWHGTARVLFFCLAQHRAHEGIVKNGSWIRGERRLQEGLNPRPCACQRGCGTPKRLSKTSMQLPGFDEQTQPASY